MSAFAVYLIYFFIFFYKAFFLISKTHLKNLAWENKSKNKKLCLTENQPGSYLFHQSPQNRGENI